jgi:hypothetical protein
LHSANIRFFSETAKDNGWGKWLAGNQAGFSAFLFQSERKKNEFLHYKDIPQAYGNTGFKPISL